MNEKCFDDTHFNHWNFIQLIAELSRDDGQIPNGIDIGREAAAYSEIENRLFKNTETIADQIVAPLSPDAFRKHIDAGGNLFYEIIGECTTAPVLSGSHLDSVGNGGKYDGVAGVANALDALQSVVQSGEKPKNSFIFAVFRSEESAPKNSYACLGSRIALGAMSQTDLKGINYEEATDSRPATSFQKHITDKYGSERWDAIVQSVENPETHPILGGRRGVMIEGHIEQSRNAALADVDMVISEGGIGGARREMVSKKLEPHSINIAPDTHKRLVITIEGASDHTGGTPPNLFLDPQKNAQINRRDALVTSCVLLEHICGMEGVSLLRSDFGTQGGPTKVPYFQQSELIVPADFDLNQISEIKSLWETGRTNIKFLEYPVQHRRDLPTVSDDSLKALRIPIEASEASSDIYRGHDETNPKDRAHLTVTEFKLTPKEISFRNDYREVDTEAHESLVALITGRIKECLASGETAIRLVSEKPHADISPEVAEILAKKAKKLNLKVMKGPVMAGHDSDTFARNGWAVAMVLYRQEDGVSHHPAETVTKEAFTKGAKVLTSGVEHFIFNEGEVERVLKLAA